MSARTNLWFTATRRHDVPSGTSEDPSATCIPNDGVGFAYDDADGLTLLARLCRICWSRRDRRKNGGSND
jgi:hypothetical protein